MRHMIRPPTELRQGPGVYPFHAAPPWIQLSAVFSKHLRHHLMYVEAPAVQCLEKPSPHHSPLPNAVPSSFHFSLLIVLPLQKQWGSLQVPRSSFTWMRRWHNGETSTRTESQLHESRGVLAPHARSCWFGTRSDGGWQQRQCSVRGVQMRDESR